MRVFIQTQGVDLSKREQQHIQQRLHQALSRFGEKAIGATLYLRDINGPRGGADKDCHLVIDMPHSTTVVRDRGDKIGSLVNRAMQKAVQTIRKQLDRVRQRSSRAPHVGKGVTTARHRRMARALSALPDSA